jgi:hypothetical protein
MASLFNYDIDFPALPSLPSKKSPEPSQQITFPLKLMSGEILSISFDLLPDHNLFMYQLYIHIWNVLPSDIKCNCKARDLRLLSDNSDGLDQPTEKSDQLKKDILNGEMIYLFVDKIKLHNSIGLGCSHFKKMRDSLGRKYKLVSIGVDYSEDGIWDYYTEEYETFKTWKIDFFIRLDDGKPIYYHHCDVYYNPDDEYDREKEIISIIPDSDPCYSMKELIHVAYDKYNEDGDENWKTIPQSVYLTICDEFDEFIQKSLYQDYTILDNLN